MPRRASVDLAAVGLILAPGRSVAARSELIALGVPGSTITHRCRPGGPWQSVLPGVVAGHRGILTVHERRLGALRYAHPDAVLSGVDALVEHGIKVTSFPDGGRVQVLVPDSCQRRSHGFAVVTRTRRLEAAAQRHGLPRTSVARAVVEASRRTRALGEVRSLVAAAVQGGWCTPEEIAAEVRLAARARTAAVRIVLEEVGAGVRSVPEAELRAVFARHGVPAPRWNAAVRGGDGVLIAVVDALWEAERVVAEVDSMEWHLSPEAYQATQRRQRRLVAAGWTVLPIAPRDVRTDPRGVCREVLEVLAAARGR